MTGRDGGIGRAVRGDGHSMSIAFTLTLLGPDANPATRRSIAAVVRDDTERRQFNLGLRQFEQQADTPGA